MTEVNGRPREYGPNRADRTVGREEIEEALLRLPQDGPTDPRGLASDLAGMIATGMVPRMRGGAMGLELETGFELGGLEHADKKYPKLITTPAYSLVVDYTPAMSGPNIGRGVPIIEIVLNPVNALEGETGRLSREEAFGSLSFVLDRLRNARLGSTVAEIFRDVPEAKAHRYAHRATLLGDRDRGRIYTQFNVGVPMSGVRELLQAVAQGNRFNSHWVALQHAENALVFGDEVTARFAGIDPEEEVRESLDRLAAIDADLAKMRNYATLVYSQIASMLHWRLSYSGLAKHHTLIASRTPLAELRRSLPNPVRRFLENEAAGIRNLFQGVYRAYNSSVLRRNQHVPESGDLLVLDWSPGDDGRRYTIGEYLDNALVTAPAHVVDQWESLGIAAELPETDADFGRRRSDPLVVLEVRSFGADKHGSLEEIGADYDRLERVARRADEESGTLRQLERGVGLEVRFAKGDHANPDWGRPGALEQFGKVAARAAKRWRAAERGTLFINVEGGGNGGLLSNAHTTGLDRADAVIQELNRELLRLRPAEGAIGFIRSSSGSRDGSDYPFPQVEGSPEERRRRVRVWIEPSSRPRRVTGQAQPGTSTSHGVMNAPRFSPDWTNALTAGVDSAYMKMTGQQASVPSRQGVLTAYNSLPERLTNEPMSVVAHRIAEFILTGQVTVRRGGSRPSAPAGPVTQGPGGIRPMKPPSGRGKGKDVWHTLVRPVTEGSGTHLYEVSEAGWIRLADGRELSPDSWVRWGEVLVHWPTGMSLRGEDGRIEPIAGWETLRDSLGDDTLVPHILWADESYVYLRPESGGQVMGLPLEVGESGSLARDIHQRPSAGTGGARAATADLGTTSEASRPPGSGGSAEPGADVVFDLTPPPATALPDPDHDRRMRTEVDDWLVDEVNKRLRGEYGWDRAAGVDREEVEATLRELPQGGPSNKRGVAYDLATRIDTGTVPRMGGGGLGFEGETRIVVRLPEGVDDRWQDFRIDARDGSLQVVLDNVWYFRATDENLYRSRELVENAGEEVVESFYEHILEIVTAPVWVVPGDRGRADGAEVLARIEEVVGGLQRVRGGERMQSVFPEARFEYSDVARDALLHPDPLRQPFKLHLQLTVGVPITRMHEFLSTARDQTTEHHAARDHLADGLNFGDEIAAEYASTLPDHAGHQIPPYAVHLLAERADVSALRGFLSLVYAQVAPIVHGMPTQVTSVKARVAATSRTSLAGIRATLPEPVRGFLENRAADIRRTLIRTMQGRRPEIRGTDPLSRRGLRFSDRTIGEYLDTALLDSGRPPSINQHEALGVDAHFDEPDTNPDTGRARLEPPLVLVELRRLDNRKTTMNGLRSLFISFAELAQRAYMEARVVETAPDTRPGRRVVPAAVAGLTMFRAPSTDRVQGTEWVRGIDSLLATAWRLDPVLRGVARAHAVITQDRVERIVHATSAVLRGDHSGVEALTADLSEISDHLERLRGDASTVQDAAAAVGAARTAIADLRRMASSTRPDPLRDPDPVVPEPDRRSPVVDEGLVAEVNSRLDAFGPIWTGGRVDAARIRDALDELPENGPPDVFELATDLAFHIVGGSPPSLRDGLRLETGFELGGLEDVADEYSMLVTTPAYALVAERVTPMRGPDAGRVMPTLEIVLTMANAPERETGRPSREAFDSLSFVLDRLRSGPRGSTIADVFGDVPGADLHPYAHQATLPSGADPGRISTRFNVGVPMSGVRELLRAVAQGNDFRPDWVAHRHAESALDFGDEVAARAGQPEGGLPERHAARVRDYATLVYTQVASMLHGLLSDSDPARHNTLIASRAPLTDLRRSMPKPVRRFLASEAPWIRDLFRHLYRAHNAPMLLDNRHVPESGELLAVEWRQWDAVTRTDGPAYTIGQYLDNALVATEPAGVVDQWNSLGIPTLPPEMDGALGQRRSDPLVVLEVQSFGAPEHVSMRGGRRPPPAEQARPEASTSHGVTDARKFSPAWTNALIAHVNSALSQLTRRHARVAGQRVLTAYDSLPERLTNDPMPVLAHRIAEFLFTGQVILRGGDGGPAGIGPAEAAEQPARTQEDIGISTTPDPHLSPSDTRQLTGSRRAEIAGAEYPARHVPDPRLTSRRLENVAVLRNWLADRLLADFRVAQQGLPSRYGEFFQTLDDHEVQEAIQGIRTMDSWDHEMGDMVAEITARELGLIAPDYPSDAPRLHFDRRPGHFLGTRTVREWAAQIRWEDLSPLPVSTPDAARRLLQERIDGLRGEFAAAVGAFFRAQEGLVDEAEDAEALLNRASTTPETANAAYVFNSAAVGTGYEDVLPHLRSQHRITDMRHAVGEIEALTRNLPSRPSIPSTPEGGAKPDAEPPPEHGTGSGVPPSPSIDGKPYPLVRMTQPQATLFSHSKPRVSREGDPPPDLSAAPERTGPMPLNEATFSAQPASSSSRVASGRPDEQTQREEQGRPGGLRGLRRQLGRVVYSFGRVRLPGLGGGPARAGRPGATEMPSRPATGAGVGANGTGIRTWRTRAVRVAGVFASLFRAAGDPRQPDAGPPAAEPGGQISPAERMRGGAIGLELETGFELGGLEDAAHQYPKLITTPAYSLVVDYRQGAPIIEIVLEPVNALDGETGWLSREEAFGSLSFVLQRLHNAGRGSTVAEVFRDVPGAVAHPHAHQATLLGATDPARIYTQFNVGVPMTGVRELLRAVAQGNRLYTGWVALRHAENALVFGDQVAARYAGMDPVRESRERLDRLATLDVDVARVRSYATLVYTQVASMLHWCLSRSGLAKQHTLIASRTPLAELRGSLPRRVRRFLENDAAVIRGQFQNVYRAHNGAVLRDRYIPQAGNLLAVEWRLWDDVPGPDDPVYTIGEYLDNALVSDPARVVDQWNSLGVFTQLPEMDHNFGRWRSDPLVVFEVGSFGAFRHGSRHGSRRELSADYDRLEEVARRADEESGILQRLERGAGLEVRFARADHANPDWGRPGAIEQFGKVVARAAGSGRAAERGTLFVVVEGGGNGGLLSNAYTTGLARADAVIQELNRHVGRELRRLGLPNKAVGFIRSSRGGQDGSDYPFPQAEGSVEERRRRVHVWVESSGPRRPVTEQAESEASTTYGVTNAPSFSPEELTAEVNSAYMEMTGQERNGIDQQRVAAAYDSLPEWLKHDLMSVVARRVAEFILTGQVTLRKG
ncbi:hypothetical protein [Actinoallomurus sp. CA-142502]|uniref:hypothetical protein n=1 Tax=Actinoallomurus sp. CA-142502 TaxID=3239885 RepID=UPI003D910498